MSQTDEDSLKIVFADFLDLVALDANMIHHQFLAGTQSRQINAPEINCPADWTRAVAA